MSVTCNYCKNNVEDGKLYCPVCIYPIGGSEQDQAVFVAGQVIKEDQVRDAFKDMQRARFILFGLAGLFLVRLLFSLSNLHWIDIVFYSATIFVFAVFGAMLRLFPKVGVLIPFIIVTLLYLSQIFMYGYDGLIRGFIGKIAVMAALGYVLFSIFRADRILKENPYLSERLGMKSVSGF